MKEEWKNRIYDYEVSPPAKTWERISAALDESHLDDQFPLMLHEMEINPPSSAWKKIAATLGSPVPGTKFRRISPFVRYAAAAAILAFLVWGGIQMFRSENAAEQPVVTTGNPVQTNPTNNLPLVREQEQEKQNDDALEESKNTFARLDLTAANQRRLNDYQNFTRPVNAELEIVQASPESTYRELNYREIPEGTTFQFASNNSLANRYIMLMTPEGNIIRMSKKLGDLVCCVSGEEQDEDCKSQLNKWRSKIVSASSNPGNFMDLLQIVNSLQSSNH